MTLRARRRRLAPAGARAALTFAPLLATVLATLPAVAGARAFHLALRRAEPAAGATVAQAPAALRLWFTQRPELAVTRVTLRDAAGAEVPTGALTRADAATAPIVVPVQGALRPGRYRVEWRTMARDGHVQRGDYQFTLAAAR